MNQSANVRTVRRTVPHPPSPLQSTRLRLHLPRQRARDELRALADLIDVPVETPDHRRNHALGSFGSREWLQEAADAQWR